MPGQQVLGLPFPLFVCAWCEPEREPRRPAASASAANWSICPDCLRRELAALRPAPKPLVRGPAQARKRERSAGVGRRHVARRPKSR